MTDPPDVCAARAPAAELGLLDGLGLGVFELDAEGRVHAWSAAMETLTGVTADDARGRAWSDLSDGAFAAAAARVLEEREARAGRIAAGGAPPAGRRLRFEVVLGNPPRRLLGRVRVSAAGVVQGVLVDVPPPGSAAADLPAAGSPHGIVGDGEAIQEVLRRVRLAAATDVTTLLTGESGTGKELAARAIHDRSARARAPFLAVNCSAIPEPLLESELFGHVEGAFTGAVRARKGLFAQARGGTLFLDEIGDLSPLMQVKLLRVLQEREVRPVGGDVSEAVDVRLLAATHRDLRAAIRDGRMREDFFYRVRVFEIVLPPLRERREDIPAIVSHLIAGLAARWRRPVEAISEDAMAALVRYGWPGNVRELANAIEHAFVTVRGGRIELDDLPDDVRAHAGAVAASFDAGDEEERQRIVEALDACGWNRTETAARLGFSRVTLWKKMRRHRIDEGIFRQR